MDAPQRFTAEYGGQTRIIEHPTALHTRRGMTQEQNLAGWCFAGEGKIRWWADGTPVRKNGVTQPLDIATIEPIAEK